MSRVHFRPDLSPPEVVSLARPKFVTCFPPSKSFWKLSGDPGRPKLLSDDNFPRREGTGVTNSFQGQLMLIDHTSTPLCGDEGSRCLHQRPAHGSRLTFGGISGGKNLSRRYSITLSANTDSYILSRLLFKVAPPWGGG